MTEHTGFQRLVAEAKKHITEISPQDAANKLNSGDAVIIDVRDKDEWDEGHIPGATHMSRGTIEFDIEEKVSDPNAMIICHCGGGGRSALAAELAHTQAVLSQAQDASVPKVCRIASSSASSSSFASIRSGVSKPSVNQP